MSRASLTELMDSFDEVMSKIDADIVIVEAQYRSFRTTEAIKEATLLQLRDLRARVRTAREDTYHHLRNYNRWRELSRRVLSRLFGVQALVFQLNSAWVRRQVNFEEEIMTQFGRMSELAARESESAGNPGVIYATESGSTLPQYRASPHLPGYTSERSRSGMSNGSGDGSRFSSTDGSVRRVEYASESSSQGRGYSFNSDFRDDYVVNAGNEPEWTSNAAEGSHSRRHQVYGDGYFNQVHTSALASSGSLDPDFSTSYTRQNS